MKNRKEAWQGKVFHGLYIKKIAGKADNNKAFQWLIARKFKKGEGVILVAQDGTLGTNAFKARIGC